MVSNTFGVSRLLCVVQNQSYSYIFILTNSVYELYPMYLKYNVYKQKDTGTVLQIFYPLSLH